LRTRSTAIMRVLLLQPEDNPEGGPWSRQPWELIVDLGKSSMVSEERWSHQYGRRVLRVESYRHGIADARRVREIFSVGRGRLIDEEGIDWWDLLSLLVAFEGLTLVALLSMAREIGPSDELWATRSGCAARMLAIILNRPLQHFRESGLARSVSRVMHYSGLVRRFSGAQFKEILLDKYDAGYEWRSRFAARQQSCAEPVVLLPSAYGNVSRMAAAYAQLLPEQRFLMVATRQSGKQFAPVSNVQVRDLAAYAKAGPSAAGVTSLIERWTQLRTDLQSFPELRILLQAGVLDSFPGWLRDGVSARHAWREVLEREPVCGVLCGDDSNLYTRLPVLLAARRKIPTVDFHHGALDGRYVWKDLPCDLYLAKNEMERDYLLRVCGVSAEKVLIGAPPTRDIPPIVARERRPQSVILFSEPYEVAGMRADEVYRELLPPLCRLARENGHDLIVKLHPFESLSQRARIVREILSPDDRRLVTVVDGPLSAELLARAWFGITLESTTAIDCLQNGICCFLCGWMSLSPFEYVQQYARFGSGEVLQDARQLSEIPSRLADFCNRPHVELNLSVTADPAMLRRWLTTVYDKAGARPDA
jgi:hypothetical protein